MDKTIDVFKVTTVECWRVVALARVNVDRAACLVKHLLPTCICNGHPSFCAGKIPIEKYRLRELCDRLCHMLRVSHVLLCRGQLCS